MPLYAIEELDDAFRVTRSFLTPFDLRTWLKLAVVIFFIGGVGANFGGFQWQMPADEASFPTDQLPGDVTLPDIGADAWLLIAGFVLFALLIGLVFLLIGSVMEFVLVESLRNESVTIRRYWSNRWRQGVRLFVFRLGIGLLVFASAAVLFAPLLVGVIDGDMTGTRLGLFLVLVPVFVLLTVGVALVNSFTTMFVVPIMVLEDRRVLDGWRRLWPTIRANWQQYLAYAVAQLVLGIAAALVVGIVAGGAALVLLLPFGILAAVGFALFAVVPILGIAALGVVALFYVLALLVVVAVAQVPVMSYLRYYAMLVLGDVDSTLDLVPTQRAAAREGDATPAA